jgi:WS/DGAT/MGAT family acyltransferase
MERLTAADRVMLWPDALWPQEIGAVIVLDGGTLVDPGGRLRLERIRETISSRLHLVPRLRQLLHTPPRGLGGPLWVDAMAFDLDEHVRVVPLPRPGSEAVLMQAVERLRRERLDRSRPLWQMCFLPGLADDRVGLFVRVHHAIADGMAAIATIAAFLDTVPDPPAVPAPAWTPEPIPSTTRLLVDNLRRRTSGLANPRVMAGRLRAAWPAARPLAGGQPERETSLNRTVGPGRSLAAVRTRLDVLKHIAHTRNTTINDVLLTVIAGGLRALLHRRGEPVEDIVLRIDVPITLRAAETRAHARGNAISQMLVPVPMGTADPWERLAGIHAETARRKRDSHPDMGIWLGSRMARRVMLRLLERHPVNVTVADLPGPANPVYLAGASVLEVLPVLALMGNVTLGVGGISYAGQFTITATADSDTYPDLDVFVAGVQEDLDAMAAARVARSRPASRSR